MISWILAHIEEGCVYWWDAGGEWHTDRREEYISMGDDLRHACEAYPEILARMKDGDTFRVLLTNVSFVSEEGFWDLDYGYMFPDAHIEDGGYRIEGAEFEMKKEHDGKMGPPGDTSV